MSESGGHSYRLSVVWFTDLVGYSSLATRDQDQALALVERFQKAVERAVPREQGRVVKFIGDAALLESPSAEAALRAATALHAQWADGLRPGIHLGDVAVASDGDLYGDGVNGAQRIQTEAEPGQIVVSEDVWRRLRNRPAFVFESLGERQLKGIDPMELFRVVSIEAREPVETGRASKAEMVASPTAHPSVAVLPFVNMSSDAENEYFSDGVTEEILSLLTRVEGLKVISRTSVMQYKGTRKPMRQIGEELGVGSILEGSVRHAGGRVRITAQLIDAGTDEHLWADRYDRDLKDIFAIQSDVAERIVEALRLRLTRRERSRLAEEPTESMEAYQSYLKGRHFLSRRTVSSLQRAVECFRQAVMIDQKFAQAWVGLSDSLALLNRYSRTFVAGWLAEARSAAEEALALDPRLGEAHVSLGFIAENTQEWDEARRQFERGIELSPGYVTGFHWYASFLGSTGRFDEAIAMLERALELDPLSLPVYLGLGGALWLADRPDEALEIYRKAVDLDPGFPLVHNNMANVYLRQGRYEEALAEMETRDRLDPEFSPPEITKEQRAGYAAAGGRGFWEATLEGHASRAHELGEWTYLDMAIACAQLGRPDEAFGHLMRVAGARVPQALNMVWDPLLEPLRPDPRFDEFKRKLGLE